MKKITKRSLQCSIFFCLTTLSIQSHASDFNIPFVSAAGLGNMYSGWAASTDDASTEFTNPAGLTRLANKQIVFAAIGVSGSTSYTGSQTNPILGTTQTGTAESKLRGLLTLFYYSQPINERFVIGFGANAPFALGTNYPKDSVVSYSGTQSKIEVIDMGPSVGFKVNEQVSLGLGLDINRTLFTLNEMYGAPLSVPDAEGQNHLFGWGYGWHGGVMYQVLPCTRIGLSYNSMVMFHTSGNSEVFLPSGTEFRTTAQRSNFALPARTQLSVNYDVNKNWTLLGTVFYTNWSTLNQLTLQQTMTTTGALTSVSIPFQYHNTFDYSLGFDVKATDKWLLRAGSMFLSTPSNAHDRSVADPLGAGIILGLGTHFQQNKCLGYDLSYAHGFFQTTKIGATTPLSALDGHSSQNTNILGAQVTYNII